MHIIPLVIQHIQIDILLSMQSEPSEYFFSLQHLLNKYLAFMATLNHYLAANPNASQKLKLLATIWNHPRGISNLIQSIALKSNLQPLTPEDIALIGQPPKEEHLPPRPSSFEVKNPLLADLAVKQQEDSGVLDYGERGQLSCKKEGEDESYSQSGRSSVGERSLKRGPYKSYSLQEKEKAVALLVEEQLPITEISRMLDIPCKNIKRWSTEGVSRKRGGGRRRSSPLMEAEVRNWIRREFAPGEVVEVERVQEYALAVNREEGFKASKGWVLKFLDRARLRDTYTFR